MIYTGELEVPRVTFILQARFPEALPIAQRAAAFLLKTLGREHPSTQQTAAGVHMLELVANKVVSLKTKQIMFVQSCSKMIPVTLLG